MISPDSLFLSYEMRPTYQYDLGAPHLNAHKSPSVYNSIDRLIRCLYCFTEAAGMSSSFFHCAPATLFSGPIKSYAQKSMFFHKSSAHNVQNFHGKRAFLVDITHAKTPTHAE